MPAIGCMIFGYYHKLASIWLLLKCWKRQKLKKKIDCKQKKRRKNVNDIPESRIFVSPNATVFAMERECSESAQQWSSKELEKYHVETSR